MALDMADLTSCNYPVSILPMVFDNFSVFSRNNHVWLSWNVTETGHFTDFIIERSSNSIDWQPVGNIQPGNISKTFSFTDNNPSPGDNYYRIRMVLNNSQVKYSSIKKIQAVEQAAVSIWPNPVQDMLRIEIAGQNNYTSTVLIYDQAGRKIKTIVLQEGVNNVNVKSFLAGIYIVQVQSSDGAKTTYKISKTEQ